MTYDALRKGRFSSPSQVYFVTTVTSRREAYFDFACGRHIVQEMRHLHDTGLLESLAWVLMPDHLHWLFQLEEKADLPGVMKLFKVRSARRANQFLGRRGTVWQRACHDHALRKEEDAREIARYIVANPLRAGLVKRIGDYPLWDAAWL